MAADETGRFSAWLDKEGGVWLDKEGGVWLDSEHACDVKICFILPHDQGTACAPASSYYAIASTLSTIPYFQTCLSETWQKESLPSRHEITLQCADSTFPADYLKCLLFVNLEEPLPMSVDDALRLLRVADHLLFQKCVDYCMAYLASVSWSDSEEESIQQTISSMGMKPSEDLSAKLSVANGVKVFEQVLVSLIQKGDEVLRDFVKAALNEGSEQLKIICMSIMWDAWTTATNALVDGVSLCFKPWIVLTRLLFEYGDAERLLKDFITVGKMLSSPMVDSFEWIASPPWNKSLAEILTKLLQRAVPNKSNNKTVFLSNSDRVKLVAAIAPMLRKLMFQPLESAFLQVFMSSPVQDPDVVAVVENEAGNPLFYSCFKWWCSKLFTRSCDLIHKETDIEPSIMPAKRAKLTSAD